MPLTRAVTHIRLCDANHAKIAALDALAAEYLQLCQAYMTYFCTEAQPDKYAAPCFESPLSQRWQRVAIQQAAGIAQSWRANCVAAYQDHLDMLAEYYEAPEGALPVWNEWNTPVLKEPVIQANANVALLQPAQGSSFDYWLRLSTLEHGHPVFLPVHLAAYHRQVLAGKRLNSSTVLARKADGWWLTLSYKEYFEVATPESAPVMGIDVGIANFITISTGQHYGTFHGKLAERHKRHREKRRRKAKLRACLKKKGVTRLPSTRNTKLARHVRQEINRTVNEVSRDHPDAQVAYEQLHIAGMKLKARRMNACLYVSMCLCVYASMCLCVYASMRPIWPTSQHNWPGGRPSAASVPARSRVPIPRVPSPLRNAIAVIMRPARTVPPSKTFCWVGRFWRAHHPCRCECGREPGESSA